MHEPGPIPKRKRLEEFFRRLDRAALASNFQEAFSSIADTMNSIEDEMSGVVNDPTAWIHDGRLYPPQLDSGREVPGRPDLIRFRSVAHNTFIGKNGAILVQTKNGVVEFSKAGSDGKWIQVP